MIKLKGKKADHTYVLGYIKKKKFVLREEKEFIKFCTHMFCGAYAEKGGVSNAE